VSLGYADNPDINM